jgi:hypothetical protein
MVNPTPEDPRSHTLSERQQRRLTIHQEAEIASNLAFLSRRNKDSHNVAAIGLEEKESGQGLTVRVAVNGRMLASVVEGLTRICDVLQDIAQNGMVQSYHFFYGCRIS